MPERPSRLYRRLSDTPKPLFEAQFSGLRYTDDQIESAAITYGGDSATGVQTATCELSVTDTVYPSHSGQRLTFGLTAAAASWVAQRTGATESLIRRRFTGRSSRITIDDVGAPSQRTTNVQAAHWLALENGSRYTQTLAKGYYLHNAIRALLRRHGSDYTVIPRGTFDNLWQTETDVSWKDVGTKFVDDYGLLLAPQRSGDVLLAQLPWRLQQALDSIGVAPTLLRSQVLSPTTWDQPNEANMTKFLVKRYDTDGIYRESLIGSEPALEGDSVIEEIDWSWVKTNDNHWIMAAKSSTYSNGIHTFRLPSVNIDLLSLITSEKSHDRRQARHLLSLDVGSVVLMSDDWNNEINGPQVVTGYAEKITPDGWSLELTLSRMLHVFSEYSPRVPAEVWASANYPWTEETRRWNEA